VGGGGVGLSKGQERWKLDICGMFLFRLYPYGKIPRGLKRAFDCQAKVVQSKVPDPDHPQLIDFLDPNPYYLSKIKPRPSWLSKLKKCLYTKK
jgi:hypothetical protein